MKKILLTQLFVLTLFLGAKAQNLTNQNLTNHPRAYDHRYSQWNEINVMGSLTADKRWQYQLDIQYRRMSDASNIPGANTSNIFKNPYQQVYRPWVHYWIVPGSIRLSLSPIGYWATWTAPDEGASFSTVQNNKGVAGVTTFQNEFRTCPQVTQVTQVGRFTFSNRIRYEFRWKAARVAAQNNDAADIFNFNSQSWDFNANTSTASSPGAFGFGATHAGRIRWQARMQVLLTSKTMQKNTLYINTWNELFIGVGRHVAYNGNLDQNRTVAMLGYKLPTEFPIRVEAGVTYQMVFNGGSAGKYLVGSTGLKQNAELNTAYTVYVIFDEFHSMFKKKKQEEVKTNLMKKKMLAMMDANQD